MKWTNELAPAKSGDARLSARLNKIVEKLCKNPGLKRAVQIRFGESRGRKDGHQIF